MSTHDVYPKETKVFTLDLQNPTVNGGRWNGLAFLVAGSESPIKKAIDDEYAANNFRVNGVLTGSVVGLKGWAVYPKSSKWSFQLNHAVTTIESRIYAPFLYSASGWWKAPSQLPQNYMFGGGWTELDTTSVEYNLRLYLRSTGKSVVLPLK